MLMKYLPIEKIIDSSEFTSDTLEKANEDKNDEYELMRKAGIDINSGLRFCQNDKDLYKSIIIDYAVSSNEKIKNIIDFFGQEDWKDYATCVHALKSTSKTIGADDLSSKAQVLELAANNNDVKTIMDGHEGMLNKYKETVKAIKDTFPNEIEQNNDDVLEFSPEEDDVLEFSPDDEN